VLDIFPVVFEGGKLVVNKGLSSHFQISHTMTMSSLQPSGYKFGCTYVGTKQYSPSEVSEVKLASLICLNILSRRVQNLNLLKSIYSGHILKSISVNLFLSIAYALCLKKTRELWQAIVSTSME